MASFPVTVHVSLCCFLLLLACQAQARESQFFSKASRYVTPEKAAATKDELPPEKDEPVQYYPSAGNGNGYGLYGRSQDKLPSAATVNQGPSTHNYNNVGQNLNSENSPSEFPNNEFTDVNYESKEFNNAGYPDKKNYANNKPAYNPGNIPEDARNGGTYYNHNKEANTRYPTYANEREHYGMSDTRFMENGKYFYDLNAEESYRNGRFDPARANPREYEPFGRGEAFPNSGYGYGNGVKGNGFQENTSMQGGYQNNGENNQENTQEEEFTP